MSTVLKKLKKNIIIYKTDFIQKSFFYKLYLENKHNVFDVSKFINDPWQGNFLIGKSILNCDISLDDSEIPISFIEVLSKKNDKNMRFVASFSWIRDLQALGGNNPRKYTRNSILKFINSYKKTNKFWINHEGWDILTTSNRIVNWILGYSFFASGANDKFQKEVLSSIREQYSHLLNIYKAEHNIYKKLFALKAILFCICSMKIKNSQKIKKIINEISKLTSNNFDKSGMFLNKNPIDHFNIFCSLIEVRFVAKNSDIDLDKYEIFNDRLSDIASCVRFLRLGDGKISKLFTDNYKNNENTIIISPSQNIIDTALSFVDHKKKSIKIKGFEKLTTKKINLLVSTSVNHINNINKSLKSSIGIFDFESSFGIERLINKSGISVIIKKQYLKLNKNSKIFFKKSFLDESIKFEGETQITNKSVQFALRREIELDINKYIIKGTDFVYFSNSSFESVIKFELDKASDIKIVNKKNVFISINKSEYIFKINSSSLLLNDENENIKIVQNLENKYPNFEIVCISRNPGDIMLSWNIEKIK